MDGFHAASFYSPDHQVVKQSCASQQRYLAQHTEVSSLSSGDIEFSIHRTLGLDAIVLKLLIVQADYQMTAPHF